MPAKRVTTAEDVRRAAVEEEQLDRVLGMKVKVENISTCIIDRAELESLGIALGPPLDVDNVGNVWDSGTCFFRPWVSDEVLSEVASNQPPEIWMDKLRQTRYTQPETKYGELKAQWFKYCLEDLYEMDTDLWEPWLSDSFLIERGTGLDLQFNELSALDPSTNQFVNRQYFPKAAYFPVDRTKPHVACLTIDSNPSPGDDKVLHSEVDYAISLVKFRLEQGQHTGHHTKPGLIYTMERDQWARITQVHFAGKARKLVLRQSRQLDLRGPTPPPDAFLLLRWMANRPAGETEYLDEKEPPKEEVARDEPSSGAPKLLLGCA